MRKKLQDKMFEASYLFELFISIIVGIAIFALTIEGPHGNAWDGLKIYLIPDFTGMTFGKFSVAQIIQNASC